MKGGVEVIINSDSFVMTCGRAGFGDEEVQLAGVGAGEALLSFCERHNVGARAVNLFLSEALVFMATIDLPASTPQIGEAVRLQLAMVVPFAEKDILYSYSAVREGDNYRVAISAARPGRIIPFVEQLIEAGFIVRGLYPESQRYVTGKWRRLRWALVAPGKLSKIYVFDGDQYRDRFLSRSADLYYDELVGICGTENIFHPEPPAGSGFKSVQMLMAAPPLLKDHNMLPASYRRRDYIKLAIIALLILNLGGLAAFGGVKFWDQAKIINKADKEIARLQPLVSEVKKTKELIRKTEVFLDLVAQIKGNPDPFVFLEKLTAQLPEGSHLNQLRFNVTDGVVVINGFTNNVGELTEKLQAVGESRLQSTSRRKNMTYFQVEISLP